jgi:hypothetical protein
MPVPDRPVSGELIEAEWGQETHDATFSPKGARVHGTSSTLTGTTSVQLDLSTGDDDPGGWLGTDQIEVPTGADRLYLLSLRCTSTSGEDGTSVRVYVMVNGAEVARFQEDCDTGIQITINGTIELDLSAGDIVTIRGQRIGATPAPQVTVARLSVIALGHERGA